MDVPEAGGDGEVGADGRKGLVNIEDVFRLGVQRVVINVFVVNAILLSAGDSDFLLIRLAQPIITVPMVQSFVPSQAIVSWALHASSILQSSEC